MPSPDLTDEQGEELWEEYLNKVKKKFLSTNKDLEKPEIQQIHKSSTALVKSFR